MAEPKITEKVWDKSFEKPYYENWKETKCYAFDRNSDKKTFSIDTPPPYVNMPVHIGQATTYVLMDMFARYKRMKGFNVLFPLGLDRNGLPIEMAAEQKFKVSLTDLPREDAIAKCKSILKESSMASTESFLRLGISFNAWEKGSEIGSVYETDSPEYRSLTQDTFIDLYKKGLIYEATRVNNWDPKLQTTIADSEVEYQDIAGKFHDIVFVCKETGERLVIGTTRPELVCTCGMVIFNPEDERYGHLDGKTAISPVFDAEVPIKAHPAAVIDKGTGLMMMCSYGDLTDIRFFRDEKLKEVIAINKDGTMNEHSGPLEGLSILDARKKMIELLTEKGLIEKIYQTGSHRTPISERSKVPIEFISMPELYVKQMDYKEDMKKLAEQMNFYSPNSKQILLDWIDSVAIDWPISRRRFYATEVPLWYDGNGAVALPKKGSYHLPWQSGPPEDADVLKDGKVIGEVKDFPDSCWEGDKRVFDTWFDSSISPLYILKYGREEDFFNANTPCSVRPQGKEIVRTWLYYTVLKDYLLTGKCIFSDVWVNYHIVDDNGHKMSKSKGNVIDPKEVLDKFGAEPFRLWCAIEGNLEKTDLRCSFERIEGAQKTIVKLWNVARFVSMFGEPKGSAELTELDKWIIKETNYLVASSDEQYAKYDFHNPAIKIKHFIWETFASHYLELAKSRAYNSEGGFSTQDQDAAVYTLNYCLNKVLRIISPIMPFASAKLYDALYGSNVHELGFPDRLDVSTELTTEDIIELNSAVWKSKKDNGIPLREGFSKLTLPEKYQAIEADIKITHKPLEIEYGKEISVHV